jgi:starch-binding outer membrane protein, SusD/RagB family
MKKYYRLLILAPALLLSVWACKDSFLEETPIGQINDETAGTKKGAEELLIGAYAVLDGQVNGINNWNASEDNWIFGSVAGGDAHKGSNSGDQAEANQIERYENSPNNGYFNGKWIACYEGVARANAAIRAISKLTTEQIADADKQRLLGEATFLRGHYHFEAKKMFRDIVFVDETVEYTKNNYRLSNAGDAWPKIEADLKFAYETLSASSPDIGRVNKYAAGAMYAKCLLFQKKFAAAKPVLADVITNGVDAKGDKYVLAPTYYQNFNVANENGTGYDGTEAVFSIQASVNDGGGGNNSRFGDVLNFPHSDKAGTPGGCCGFFQPSFDFVNSFRTDALGLPLDFQTADPRNAAYNQGGGVKNDMNLLETQAFTPDATQSLDPRLDWSAGRRGIPYLDWGLHPGNAWIRDQSNGGPFSPKKHVYRKADAGVNTHNGFWSNGLTAINYNLIRFADVLLWAAEVEVEVGDLNVARGYVNQIRARAKNSPVADAAASYLINEYMTPWVDQAVARKAVHFERKLELGMEGHRFFDLVRWDEAKDFIPGYIEFEKQFLPSTMTGAKYDDAVDKYYPIPQGQIDIMGADDSGQPLLKQNR